MDPGKHRDARATGKSYLVHRLRQETGLGAVTPPFWRHLSGIAIAAFLWGALLQIDAAVAADPHSIDDSYHLAPHSAKSKNMPDLVGRRIAEVMERSRYKHARWGLMAVDLNNGRTLQSAAADDFFPIASNTKLFTIAAALEVLGADHVFETPVVYTGTLGDDGVLDGDLILVGQGDLTMGGRRNPDGSIAFTKFDHTDANALGGGLLTDPDPLAGLDDLARQVAEAGIRTVSGDVIIDDRLFETIHIREYFLSPIIINDNLIDLDLTPQGPGEIATVEWRPRTSAFEVVSEIVTQDSPGIPISVVAERIGDVTRLTLTGELATDALNSPLQPLYVHQIGEIPGLGEDDRPDEIPRFARTLFIEALERAGVEVAADTLGPNPGDELPSTESVRQLPQAALRVSAEFSEYAKLILKVSHNLGADMAAMLIGVEAGSTNFFVAMATMGETLNGMGLDPESFAFLDASGSRSYATPQAVIKLLQTVHRKPYFDAFLNGLPILGVDGSLAEVQVGSLASGNVFAKTGTGVIVDFAHLQPFLTEKALGGYIDSSSGAQLAFVVMVQNGLIRHSIFDDFVIDLLEVNDNLGKISAILWSGYY
jgi:D-alanyl-D-alanine carboxypeptidase/D-alanyl-D-alanine-endopeptidase (penicillin-binding protein 4)